MRIKPLTTLLVFLIGAILFLPVTRAFAMPYFEDATVISDDVNMRLRPSTDSPVVIKLKQGARIGVFCEETEGWYRIIYGNYRGYISTEYVFLPSTDYLVAHVLEGGLKLRQNPGSYSNAVAELSEGTGLTIRNISGDWYYAEVPGEDGESVMAGYVHKDSVALSKSKTVGKMLKLGMEGAEVKNVQQQLRKRHFMLAPATGYFGDVTEGAVKAFQRKAGIAADGIVGTETYELLFGDNDISITTAELFGITGEVKLSTWNDINKVFKNGTKALVTDVKTGRKFWVIRTGGSLHADCEPCTAEDTAVMKKCFGGKWSWDRRPIWVTIGSVTYAASQHGMPHKGNPIPDNDFEGHFCIHFKDSKVHETGKECPRHQACVQYAYDKAH